MTCENIMLKERGFSDFCRDHGITERDALNRLQEAGVISDHCVTAADIADADMPKALKWLVENK